MLTVDDYDFWAAHARDDTADALDPLADRVGTLIGEVWMLRSVRGMTDLCEPESDPGGVVFHLGQAYAIMRRNLGRPEHVTGRWASVLDQGGGYAGLDRRNTLCRLADKVAALLYVLNLVSANPMLAWVASEAPGSVYGHMVRAHHAVLTLITDDRAQAVRLHELWAGNHECTSWNLRQLRTELRAASVIVTVATVDGSAVITLPGSPDFRGGRVAETGLFWGADADGDVLVHDPAWSGLGRKLAHYCGLGSDTPVIVEYLDADRKH